MLDEATGVVKCFLKEDLQVDWNILREKPTGRRYIWILRDAGTDCFDQEELQFSNSSTFYGFDYYHPSTIKKAYHVEVVEKEGDLLMGCCQPIQNYSDYYERLKQAARPATKVTVEIHLAKGGYQLARISMSENGSQYYTLLEETGLTEEDIASVKYLHYE